MCPTRPHILVVDDDHAIRESVSELLEDEGYSVAVAENGQQALDLLLAAGPSSSRPCVILLDLMMPVMDGFELLARIAGEPRLSDIPVVVITAAGAHVVGSATSSARSILAKPVRAQALLSTVKQYC